MAVIGVVFVLGQVFAGPKKKPTRMRPNSIMTKLMAVAARRFPEMTNSYMIRQLSVVGSLML